MKATIALALLAPLLTLAAEETKATAETETAKQTAPRVKLETSLGDIVLELNRDKAPLTVDNFLGYVKKGHYDGTAFHRVIENFMIQGGGFAVTDGDYVQKPSGDPIKNESDNGLKNLRGSIAMARTSAPDSATAQFFINVKDNANLDYPSMGGYAVFGKVVEGMDVVDKIRAVPTGARALTMLRPSGEKLVSRASDVPNEPVRIKNAELVEAE